jgi:hypothetical protein
VDVRGLTNILSGGFAIQTMVESLHRWGIAEPRHHANAGISEILRMGTGQPDAAVAGDAPVQ